MRILVFGATGNVGQQTLKVIRQLKYELVGISFHHNVELAKKIKAPYYLSLAHPEASNVKSINELITKSKPDLIVNAIVGFAGLDVTIAAIMNNVDLALANKESLVVAGAIVTKLAKANKVNIYPIDSEHASLMQIIKQVNKPKFQHLYITASGGPFYGWSPQALSKVTYAQAIKHPTWNMGGKISIDSATLVNKCFEIVEAYWYFHTKNITALYHPQSYIHALVKYDKDRTYEFVAKPDMALPIKQALTNFVPRLDNVQEHKPNKYVLEQIDSENYLPIAWAEKILKHPDYSLPIIINAANEAAVELFKGNYIKFTDIIKIIDICINHFSNQKIKSIVEIYILNRDVNKYVINKWKKK